MSSLDYKISVIIATYNGEKYIEKELDSIRAQSIPVNEVLIGDDCSKDNTRSIVNKYIDKYNLSSWRLIENQTNLGLSKNFFNLLSMATGDYIFIADQDDEWMNNKVESMVKIMNSDHDIMCLSSSFDIIDKNSNIIEAPKGLTNIMSIDDGSIIDINTEDLIGHSMIRGCMMCIRKELINVILKTQLPEHLSMDLLCHDWAISIVASIVGKCKQYNKVLAHYRIHGENTSLENLDRLHMNRQIKRRINGLEMSIKSHEDLLLSKNIKTFLSDNISVKIKNQILFEEKDFNF